MELLKFLFLFLLWFIASIAGAVTACIRINGWQQARSDLSSITQSADSQRKQGAGKRSTGHPGVPRPPQRSSCRCNSKSMKGFFFSLSLFLDLATSSVAFNSTLLRRNYRVIFRRSLLSYLTLMSTWQRQVLGPLIHRHFHAIMSLISVIPKT